MSFKRTLGAVAIALCMVGGSANAAGNYNFRFNPIPLLVGLISANVDFAVGQNWTIGPELSFWNLSYSATGTNSSSTSISSLGLGARANWFKNGTFTSGLYVGPFANFVSARAESNGASGSVTSLLAGALVGYGWFWDSFNMMLGGGLALPLGATRVKIENGFSEEYAFTSSSLAFEYSLGWTF